MAVKKNKGIVNAGLAGYAWTTAGTDILKALSSDSDNWKTSKKDSYDDLSEDGVAAYEALMGAAINKALSGTEMPKVNLADEALTSLMQIATVGGVGFLVWKEIEKSKSFF
jgi:hypothetical protein